MNASTLYCRVSHIIYNLQFLVPVSIVKKKYILYGKNSLGVIYISQADIVTALTNQYVSSWDLH